MKSMEKRIIEDEDFGGTGEIDPIENGDDLLKDVEAIDFSDFSDDDKDADSKSSKPAVSAFEKDIEDENGFASFTDDELDDVYDELEDPIPADDAQDELSGNVISSLEQKIMETEGFASFSDEQNFSKPGPEKSNEFSTPASGHFEKIEPREDPDPKEKKTDSQYRDIESETFGMGEIAGSPIEDETAPIRSATSEEKPDENKRNLFKYAPHLALLIVLCVSGTYIWIKRTGIPKPEPRVEQTETNESGKEISHAKPRREKLPEKTETVAETAAISIDEKVRTIQGLVEKIESKREELAGLIEYYRTGIEKEKDEILAETAESGIVSYKLARGNNKIVLGLRRIQRRTAYVGELERISKKLLFAAEELLYVKRMTEIDMQVADIIDGIETAMLIERADKVVNRHLHDADEISFDISDAEFAPLDAVWEESFGNGTIGAEIRNGKYDRKHHLTRLSPETAKSLSSWDGKFLYLGGISNLSPDAAKGLAKWKGDWLILNGLDTLSPETAKRLFQWEGGTLSLNGLTELPSGTVKYIAGWKGKNLELAGLKGLSGKKRKQMKLAAKSLFQWEKAGGTIYLGETCRKRLEKMAK